VAAVIALALAGCDRSSTHAASSTPAPGHTGALNLSRSWTSSSETQNGVSASQDAITARIECSTPSGEKICAAVMAFRSRYQSSDARCLGRAPIGVRGVVDGTAVQLQVPLPGCLTGRLRHDAQIIDRLSPM
jgi:hypothetical protein